MVGVISDGQQATRLNNEDGLIRLLTYEVNKTFDSQVGTLESNTSRTNMNTGIYLLIILVPRPLEDSVMVYSAQIWIVCAEPTMFNICTDDTTQAKGSDKFVSCESEMIG